MLRPSPSFREEIPEAETRLERQSPPEATGFRERLREAPAYQAIAAI
jgi:hypothetical protein